MKLIYKCLIVLIVATGFMSCESFIGGDVNQDPNNPASVPVAAQMPSIQIHLADTYGGDFSRFNCMLVQQVEGVARQWVAFNQYTGLTPNRFDDAWENIYENVLNEIKIARTSAAEQGFNHYLGILDILEAYTLMTATDVWDDMPYSDALQGIAVQNPAYDTQSSIYATIYGLIDSGIERLSGAPGSVTPGSDDIFYGGDANSWIKAAFALRARGLMHTQDYAGAMAAAQSAFESAADNMGFQYPDANAAGQWFRFNRDREGDIEFHPTMREIMTNLNDTFRLAKMDQTFVISHPYLVADFFQELNTYREMQFIIAEANFRTAGGTQGGYDAYQNGIQASFARLGLSDEDFQSYWSQPEVNPGVGNLTLEMIMTQKYIAMFLQPEAYSDWRRTNIPALTPVAGDNVPVRWHYSSTEYLFNSNSPSETDVNIFTDKVGWNE